MSQIASVQSEGVTNPTRDLPYTDQGSAEIAKVHFTPEPFLTFPGSI
jgi:hypothetical protein